jgi:hypothetical protein
MTVDDSVIFVKYVPPPCDDEVFLAPPSPRTPVWTDMWEDLDTDDFDEDFALPTPILIE